MKNVEMNVEGDTLVIETAGYNEETYLDATRIFPKSRA